MMEFSTEELDFFQDIFSECSPTNDLIEKNNNLSIQTHIPNSLKNVLDASQLTLLAQISHYQLWFPATFTINEAGEFCPILGTPEIIDVQGHDRSWRIRTPENISFVNSFQDQNIEIISLSTSGITLSLANAQQAALLLQQSSLEIRLPNDSPVTFTIDLVRSDDNFISAKFKDFKLGKDALRQFLFNSHKAKYSELYREAVL